MKMQLCFKKKVACFLEIFSFFQVLEFREAKKAILEIFNPPKKIVSPPVTSRELY